MEAKQAERGRAPSVRQTLQPPWIRRLPGPMPRQAASRVRTLHRIRKGFVVSSFTSWIYVAGTSLARKISGRGRSDQLLADRVLR